ncbi:MAG: ABC transporter ATP-binding protein [Chloroflexi bacterium]|nr:ABC transporter ATP-binding protein [Chloroflexota bacterium]OJV88204.1 MAG: hypothetical protein BGO39_08410 [Chloroflexi bacterium 54-19]
MSSVKLEALTKKYGDNLAISNLNLECQQGEFIVLLGRPGAGKSTTLKLIANIEELSSGNIYFNDQLINNIPTENRNVAMAFESYALYPHWTVRKNLEFPLKAPGRNIPAAEQEARIRRVAELLEIAHLLDRKPSQLSGGQRQRVSLGRALVRPASVTLLDEPIAHLDARLRHSLRGELKQYQREQNATTFYTTPDYVEATAIADKIAVLIDGQVRQFATPEVVYDEPADIEVATIVGDPKMNILPLAPGATRLEINEAWLQLPPLPPEAGYIGIRPVNIQIFENAHPYAIRGTVYVTEPMGYEQVIRVEAGEQLLNIKTLLTTGTFSIGQTVWLQPDWTTIHVFDRSGQRLKGGFH